MPIAFASRVLNKAEKNYAAIEKELLSVVWAVNHFRPYIYGREFIIVTDHKPLVWLCSITNPSSKLTRWRIKLEEYQFKIVHKAGKQNTNADCLSRIQIEPPVNKVNINVLTRAQKLQQTIADDKGQLSENNKSIVKKDIVDLTDQSEIETVINEFHHSASGGHQGIYRTYNRLLNYYRFPNMLSQVTKIIRNCKSCQTNKSGSSHKMPMKITTTSSRPFEKLFMDIVGPLNTSHNDNKFILTMQDDLTKFSLAVPIPNQEADTVARAFVENFVCVFGIPSSILTDQGSNFMSALFTRIAKLFKIRKLNTTAYHPQSNGALERSHKTFMDFLRSYSNHDPLNWDSWVPFAIFCYNTTPHSSTKFMPFELVFGCKPQIPSSLTHSRDIVYNYDDYYFDLKYKMQQSFEIAKNHILESKQKSKNYYDKHSKSINYNVGDLVCLKNETRNSKLSKYWLGPYEVQQIISPENTSIRIGNSTKIVHNNRLKHFHESPDI